MLEAMPRRVFQLWIAHYLLDARELEEARADGGGSGGGREITPDNFDQMMDRAEEREARRGNS